LHLSNSGLQTYLKCGEMYRRKYECGDPDIFGWPAQRGNCLHWARKRHLRQKVKTLENLPKAEVIDFGIESYREPEQEYKKEVERNAAEKQIVSGVGFDYDQYQTAIIPDLVEQRAEVYVQKWDITLVGIMDLIDGQKTRLRDLKTSAKKPSEIACHNSTQLSIYFLMLHLLGVKIRKIQLDYVIYNKKGINGLILPTSRTQADMKGLESKLEYVIKAIRAGIFPPAPDFAWWCSPKSCSYYDTCPYVTKRAKSFSRSVKNAMQK